MSQSLERTNLRDQVMRVRQDAIVAVVNRLLVNKGYDAMTVDEVAAEVGMAKASLYKHFPSKEALAAEAMVRVLERTLSYIEQASREEAVATLRLRALVRWIYEMQLKGEMPSLPSQNSSLRTVLMQDMRYLGALMRVSNQLTDWISDAQAQGGLDKALPPQFVLFTLFARACDPVLPALQSTGEFSDVEMLDLLERGCFSGLSGPSTPA